MRSELLALSALCCFSCATGSPTRRVFEAPSDELFEATWLALENEGLHVDTHDRVAGQLAWAGGEISIAAVGTDEELTLTPANLPLLDAVERRVRTTFATWRRGAEWTFDAHRNLLYVNGFSVELPPDWAGLRFDVSRRRVTSQEQRARTDGNPTLVAEIERRAPRPTAAKTLRHAVEAMLNGVELNFDDADAVHDELGLHGQLTVALASGPVPMAWQAYQHPVGDFQVTLVMVCPEERAAECEQLWKRVQKSALTPAR